MPPDSRTTADMGSVFVTDEVKHLSMAPIRSSLDFGATAYWEERGREAYELSLRIGRVAIVHWQCKHQG